MAVKNLLNFLRAKQDVHDAYRETFDTEAGKQVLDHLCRNCYVYGPSYVPGDPTETAHREGMRRVVLSIIRELESPDEILSQMIKESFDVSTQQTPEREY